MEKLVNLTIGNNLTITGLTTKQAQEWAASLRSPAYDYRPINDYRRVTSDDEALNLMM